MKQAVDKDAGLVQKINPGLAKEVWDEVLVRSGIDPATITEYNVKNSPAEDEKPSQK